MLVRNPGLVENSVRALSLPGDAVHRPWNTVFTTPPRIPKLWGMGPLFLGLFLFVMNSLAPLGALLHPRPGYTPLLMPRNQDSAQYLTWIEAFKNSWAIPNYHAPWKTEAALHVPLMWATAKVASLTQAPSIYSYLGLEAICYVLAFYALAFLLKVFTISPEESVLAVGVMICAVPLRSLALLPALLFKGSAWALTHCGYGEFLGGGAADGFFQGVTSSATVTFGTATALLSLALWGRYFRFGRRTDLWIASLILALSGFLHPFEFIPITIATALVLLWTGRNLQSVLVDLSILCVPALAVVLFYFVPTLTHSWLKIVTDLNQFHGVRITHHEILAFGWPLLFGVVLAFVPSKTISRQDCFLACYVVVAAIAIHMPFLPWPGHFKDGLNYGAGILIVRKLDTLPSLMRLWPNRNMWRLGFVILLVAAALVPHIYFRYITYKTGTTATEAFGQDTAFAAVDEGQAVTWLRAHNASENLILAPLENAPWMATVPMHSFASHWIFSLTDDQQAALSQAFFQGSLSDGESDSLLKSYGVRYVLAPMGSPALRYVRNAEVRWTGQRLALYEILSGDMKPLPSLRRKLPSGHLRPTYIWEQPVGSESLGK
jgi:hypothetical protein